MKALERLTRARSVLILDHCFWGVLSLKLKLIEANYVPTLATNGDAVLFNPDFVDTLNNQELVGVMAHEVGHCALGHCWRSGNRDPEVANMAMDYVLNGELVKAGFTLPKGALIDNQFTGMSFEEARQQGLVGDIDPES